MPTPHPPDRPRLSATRPAAGRRKAARKPVRRPDGAPPTLGAALAELIRIKGVAGAGGDAELSKHWRAAAGDRVADRTRVVGVRNGALHVGVQNSALLGELASFHKDRLLDEMKRRLPAARIRSVKFKLNGELRKPPAGDRPPGAPPDPGAGTRQIPRDKRQNDG